MLPVKEQLVGVESSLLELNAEYERSNNVVDVSAAFQFFKIFKDNFESQPVAVQAEILKDYIKRIVVQESVVIAEIYGKKQEAIPWNGGSGNLNFNLESKKVSVLRPRTSVRTDFELAAVTNSM